MLDKHLICGPTIKILDAMQLINKNGQGILIIVDNDKKIIGTVTDGDIRRAILKQLPLDQPISLLLKKELDIYSKPITVKVGTSRNEIEKLMHRFKIHHIPVVDEDEKIMDLVTLDQINLQNQSKFDAVVLGGGIQSRLHPLAQDLPRPMLPINNKPLLEYTLDQLKKAGLEEVTLTTYYKKSSVSDYFGDGKNHNIKINYVDENEPKGSAGSLKSLNISNKPILVINGDVLTNVNFQAMLDYHELHQADLTVAARLHEFHIPYGVLETSEIYVNGVAEKPTFQKFINAGAYLIKSEIIKSIPQDQTYDMTELINELVRKGKKVITFPIHEYWKDIKDYEDYQQAISDVKNGVFEELVSSLNSLEPGAPPPPGIIPLCVPEIRGNEWFYIKECLDTNWVSSVGPFVDRFERMVAEFSGNKFGVATSSGTAALHIALLVAGIKPDYEVIMPTLTFIAPANAVRYIGAWPVFIDVEPEYWQMDTNKLAQFLEENCDWDGSRLINKNTGRRIKAILPVHILGHPCKMDDILLFARKYNLKVIEDATESLGAKFMGGPVGHLGDIACFSFNGNKLITTGGGGMIVTDNEEWAKKAKYLTTQAKDDPLEYIHNEVGYNYRLTNVLAAFGCAQMEQLPEYINKKREIAKVYEEKLTHIPGITTMKEASWAFSVFWMYTILVDKETIGIDSRSLLKQLGKQGIQTRPLWQPLHASPIYKNQVIMPSPIAENINKSAISLPCSIGLNSDEQLKVIKAITSRN